MCISQKLFSEFYLLNFWLKTIKKRINEIAFQLLNFYFFPTSYKTISNMRPSSLSVKGGGRLFTFYTNKGSKGPFHKKYLFHCSLHFISRYLCEEKDIDVNLRDKWDSTPLYYACLCGHQHIVEYLLHRLVNSIWGFKEFFKGTVRVILNNPSCKGTCKCYNQKTVE